MVDEVSAVQAAAQYIAVQEEEWPARPILNPDQRRIVITVFALEDYLCEMFDRRLGKPAGQSVGVTKSL